MQGPWLPEWGDWEGWEGTGFAAGVCQMFLHPLGSGPGVPGEGPHPMQTRALAPRQRPAALPAPRQPGTERQTRCLGCRAGRRVKKPPPPFRKTGWGQTGELGSAPLPRERLRQKVQPCC